MVTVEKVAGGRYYHDQTGVVTVGDVVEVNESLAAYLCDERGDFERSDIINVDYEVLEEDGPEDDLESMTYDELYDLAADRDVDGRSEMDKAALIDALRED